MLVDGNKYFLRCFYFRKLPHLLHNISKHIFFYPTIFPKIYHFSLLQSDQIDTRSVRFVNKWFFWADSFVMNALNRTTSLNDSYVHLTDSYWFFSWRVQAKKPWVMIQDLHERDTAKNKLPTPNFFFINVKSYLSDI